MTGSRSTFAGGEAAGVSSRLASTLLGRRRLLIALFGVTTIGLGVCATGVHLDAGFLKTLPQNHSYVQTFLAHRESFGGANRIVIAVRQRVGTIFNARFFAALEGVTDEVFHLPGVDRGTVRSLFTPNVRFVEIVEGGFSGGAVIPHDFQPTRARLAEVRRNISKSPLAARLVAPDMGGALVTAKLVELDPDTGQRLDYRQVAQQLESRIRAKYSGPAIDVHIIGFAPLIGEITDEAAAAGVFLLVTVGLTLLALLLFTRAWRVTFIALACAATAVIWQVGLVTVLGFGVDPMSVVVLFLVFAIAVSHGIQMVNAFGLAQRDGAAPREAATSSLARLLVPATVALFSDIAGFLTVLTLDIGIVREMALVATVGIGALLLINLGLLPALLSYVRLVPPSATGTAGARLRLRGRRLVLALLPFTRRRVAALTLVAAAVVLMFGLWLGRGLAIGDTRPGAPALRADSKYNRDAAAIARHFSLGLDVLAVFVEGKPEACIDPATMATIDRLDNTLAAVPGVQGTVSLPRLAKHVYVAWNEGHPKWHVLPRSPAQLRLAVGAFQRDSGLLNFDCSVMPVYAFTEDHRAETIAGTIAAVKDFVAREPVPGAQGPRVRLAGGNLGLMAATNETIAAAQGPMLLYLYASIIALCLISFRSWRGAVCVIVPLALVSVLTYAVMAVAGIGLKVATLPVVALGAGIGVDYAIYVYSQLRRFLNAGMSLREAYRSALQATGKAVLFTAATLGAGVGVWMFSGLRLQADMGLLLTFMFLGNMVAALVLLPALAAYLLPTPAAEPCTPSSAGGMGAWYRRARIRLLLRRLRSPRDVLRLAGRRYGERTALVTPRARLTFAQLQDRVLRLSAGWEHHGVGRGSHVFSLLPDDHEQIEFRLATAETGVIPTSFHEAHPLELILKAARMTPPSVFVYDAELGGVAAEQLQREQQSIMLLRIGPGGSYEGLLARHSPRPSRTPLSPQDPAGLGFTSGTTGEPKALFVRSTSVMESLKRVVRHVRVPPRPAASVFLVGIPLIGAGSGVVLPALLAGGTIVIPSRYEAEELVRLIEQERATRLFVTPSLLIDILDLPDLDQRDLSSLEGLIYGSETTAPAKIEEAIRRIGPILQQGYGMAEVHPPLSMLQPEEHVRDGKPAPRDVLRSVGRPVPGVDVRVVDEDGRPVAPGEIGELLVRSPTMFAGYWQRPDLTEKALRDGYMRTSDFGFLDAEGRLHVLNRRNDLVQRDGHTIYPRRVEEVIHDHPAVKEACLVQVNDAVVMCVSLRHASRHRLDDAQLAVELLSFLADKVEPWQRPDRVEVMVELPRSFLGKVLRREVREALASRPSASSSTTKGETA